MKKQIFAVSLVSMLLAACDCCEVKPVERVVAEEVSTIVPGSKEDFVKNVGDRVYFAYDKSNVDALGKETLSKQAEWLNKYCDQNVTISGHCDERGTTAYNMALGERRANAVAKALIALGVSKNRINTCSYGKERPIVEGNSEEAYAKNRVAISVLSNKSSAMSCAEPSVMTQAQSTDPAASCDLPTIIQ